MVGFCTFIVISWLNVLLVVASNRDAYKILGVNRSAGARQIKKGFREASKKWHPDLHVEGKAEAEAKFKDITWAYDVLSDSSKRSLYDKYGEKGLQNNANPHAGAYRDPFNGMFNFRHEGGDNAFPGGDIFGEMFGGNVRFGGHQQQGKAPPRIAPVKWFNDSPITLVSKSLETAEMDSHWPDAVIFLSSVGEESKAFARTAISVAEELASVLEFQAVDCRIANSKSLCSSLRKDPNSDWELQLLSKTDIETHSETQPPVLPHNLVDSEAVMNWISVHLPLNAKMIMSTRAMETFLRSSNPKNLPVAIFITNEDVVDAQEKKMIAEAIHRIKFGVVPRGPFRRQVMERLVPAALASRVPKKGPYVVHVADPDVINEHTIEILDPRQNNNFTFLTLAKWVAMKKNHQGIYENAAKQLRVFDGRMVDGGVCGSKDSHVCVFMLSGDADLASVAFRAVGNNAMRLYRVDKSDARVRDYLDKCFEGIESAAIVGYKPLRKKYVVLESMAEVAAFMEGMTDGSALLRKGQKVKC